MLPPLESKASVLVPDMIVFLDQLRQFVSRRGLAGCGRDWAEVVRMFADDRAFLDFSARRFERRPRVLIEFGVQSGDERHVVGFVDAFWDAVNADFLRIESISLDGALVDLEEIAVRLTPYLNLPAMAADVVPLAEAA